APFDVSPDFLRSKKRAILFLRSVVIITASYLVLFANRAAAEDPRILAFIAVFFATNLLGAALPAAWFEGTVLRTLLVLFDTTWINLGMILAGESQGELFLLYFLVLFLAALGESEAMIAGGCALIALLYLVFLLRTQPLEDVLTPAILLRFPFLFGIATFYGYLVSVAKRERQGAVIAREHERYRTDLLATLTHDLQTPLSAIASLADVLLAAPDGLDARERRRVSEGIKKAATESAELVGNFLAMASAEAGKRTSRRRPVDLNGLAKDALQQHRRLAAEKAIRLDARLVESLPPISGDQALLRRAVTNLLRNAIKFVPIGGRIELTTGLDGGAVTLT
ncbi:MAG: sensor histidine kinase, partial [Candidatus Binatia bacterium]